MQNWNIINESIIHREPCRSFEENTYYTQKLFEHFCEHRNYKYLAIFGYYKGKYKWTDEEALSVYNSAPDGWTDGVGVYRSYDWGKGENYIKKDVDWEWHDPQLDHIVAYARAKALGWTDAQINHPSNFQTLPAIINRILSDMTDEQAPALLPIIVAQFPGVKL